ncbi:MAG: DUF1549 domain-containing protein [Planctomycetes bacterium]|nr:DUF1549 domain-containing protein [Planctomycetota bacterium]MCB9936273.1 DUF1549 domain-containing protein [Planctomycetota bacterium]
MLQRSALLSGLALTALLFGVLSEYGVRADDIKKTEAKEQKLGQDWSAMRDGLNGLFGELQKDANIKPSKICDDDTFLRRIYLDLLGRPPLPAEIEAFNPGRKDAEGRKGSEKREALIERLLAHPEHAEHFADYWMVTMIGRDADGNARKYLRQYLRQAFADNKPWNELVYTLVAAKGKTPENPELGYLMAFQNLKADMAGITSKVFMGKQIQCAECHDHPYEHWTQDDFEGMEAFFRPFSTGQKGDGANRYWFNNDQPIRNEMELVRRSGMKGKYKGPTFLGGDTIKFEADKAPREALGEWLTSADNHWFRNMTVNRYMAYFLGMGFVTPVDDFNSINEPTFPVVLEQMGKDFAASGFNTHYIIKAICSSELYQREVDTNRTNRDDFMYYSRSFVKRLTPEQIQRSIMNVIGVERLNQTPEIRDVPENQLTEEEKAQKKIRDGVQNWKNNLARLMRDAYGADPQMYEFGDFDGTIIQALMMMNADLLNTGMLKNAVTDIVARYPSHKDRIYQIFMTVLGRKPSKMDLAILNATFANWGGSDNAAYEDLFVALMNTTEFITNH